MARATTVGYAASTFTPTLTCATVGDLSVSYSTQAGTYFTVGDICFFSITLGATPTYTTATGRLRIGGLPFTVSASNDSRFYVAFCGAGVTLPVGSTSSFGEAVPTTTYILCSGDILDSPASNIDITNITTATTATIFASGWFRV